jgi:hypothetical protein
MTDTNNSPPAAIELYQLYLAADGPTKNAIHALLTNKPEHRPVTNILPIDELEQRLLIVKQLETDIADLLRNRNITTFTNFDSFTFAALLIAPLQQVQGFTTKRRSHERAAWKTSLEAIKPLMKICMSNQRENPALGSHLI